RRREGRALLGAAVEKALQRRDTLAAPGEAGHVHVIGARLLEREPDEFPAALYRRPVIQFIAHARAFQSGFALVVMFPSSRPIRREPTRNEGRLYDALAGGSEPVFQAKVFGARGPMQRLRSAGSPSVLERNRRPMRLARRPMIRYLVTLYIRPRTSPLSSPPPKGGGEGDSDISMDSAWL